MTTDPEGARAVRALGVTGLPVVTRDEAAVVGFDLAEIDRLVGLDGGGSSPLPAEELVARSGRLLHAAGRYALQLPPAHHDDAIPGMEDADGPFLLPDGRPLRFPDGTPFAPHRTALGLVRHILAHGVKFRSMADDPDVDLSDLATFALLGEPSEDVSVDWLVGEMTRVASDIERWWEQTTRPGLDRVVATFAGPTPLHDMLHTTTYSLAHHTRQLMAILVDLGIRPDGPLTGEDQRGLDLPQRIWD